jgi:hypothetical protein
MRLTTSSIAPRLVILIFLLPILTFGQRKEQLTASQIVDSSLVFCGGETRISKIETSTINYLLIQPDTTTAIINEQCKTGEKYIQCILSKMHYPQTTFYDGQTITRINGNSITKLTDTQSVDEIKLKTYNQIQYGYKKLGYQLTRLPDQKFKNFDCFVVSAKRGNGYTTVNFFDKTNFRLLMVTYPNGDKSLMIDYTFKDSILYNSSILNSSPNSADVQILKLISVDLNPTISDTWFNCPYKEAVYIPEYIKTGKFISTNGVDTRFTRTATFMDYTDEKGDVTLKRYLTWGAISPDSFTLTDEPAGDSSSSSQILVRIISWDNKGYVCQWITDKHTGTQDYKLVK